MRQENYKTIMNKVLLAGFFIFWININLSIAQTVDLTSVDEFFNVTSTLKEGKEISKTQWGKFDSSICYKNYAARQNKFVINTIKNTIRIVFGKDSLFEKDSILNITKTQMKMNPKMMFKKNLLINYLNINSNYDSIKSFRENYNFNELFKKSIQRLNSFLGQSLDSTIKFKPIYFLFITADGKNNDEALYIDLNFIYKKTESQRIDFLAHELFHNYREYSENHDFNYKSDLNHILDMIQNEGIADLIDKSEGYKSYFTENGELSELGEIFTDLYNNVQNDMEILQDLVVKYSNGKISENKMIDGLMEVVKYNGHPIGFYMANQIVRAGYQNQMLKTFYDPYEFYSLYNKVAKEQNLFQFNNEFMVYLKEITKEYYR
jgi:hypothetical protein